MASERQVNAGLLFIRLGIAAGLLVHALPRLFHGARTWAALGRELRFWPAAVPDQVSGLILLAIETLAGICLLSGYLFRLSAALAAATYGLYFFHFYAGGNRTLMWYAAMVAWIAVGLVLSGPGGYAVAVKIESK